MTATSANGWLSWFSVALVTLLLALTMILAGSINLWTLAGVAGLTGLVLGWICLGEDRRRLFRFSPRLGWLALAETLVLLALTYLGFSLMAACQPGMVPWVEGLYAQLDSPPGLPLALPILFAVVVAEELIWRGVLFNLLQRWLSGWKLVCTCALGFSAAHLLSGQYLFAVLVVLIGLFWTAQRLVHRNLWVPIITHLLWNLMVMVWVPLGTVV